MNSRAGGIPAGVDRTPSWVSEIRKSPPAAERVRVLVVDDLGSMRNVMTGILKSLGFVRIFEADNGQDALRRLEAGGIDLLITDWNMPAMTGGKLTGRPRQSEKVGRLPILMVSADAGREQIAQAAGHGLDGFIAKPFTPGALSAKLGEILQRKREVLEMTWLGRPTGKAARATPSASGLAALGIDPGAGAASKPQPVKESAAADTDVASDLAADRASERAKDPAAKPPAKRFKLSSI